MRPSLVALFLLVVPLVAHAQPGSDELSPPPSEPPPPPPPPGQPPPPPTPIIVAPPPPVTTVDRGVIEDANSGRNWLTPTALTPPAGTWSFSDFELLLVSGSYAITDQVSISATTLLPITEDFPFFGMLSGKFQLLRQGNIRFALQGAVVHMSERLDDPVGDDFSVTVGNVGGALTLCIDRECHSHITGYLGAGFAQEDQSSVPFVAAIGATFRLGRHVKAVLEADTAFILGDIDETSNGFLGWYGVRFTSKMIGVDLGFMKPIYDSDGGDDDLLLGIPFVSFTYRSFKE